jgi:hypothetical protein
MEDHGPIANHFINIEIQLNEKNYGGAISICACTFSQVNECLILFFSF